MRPRDIAVDFMNPARCVKRMHELDEYAPLRGKKLLEIGSGYGSNLATCIADFGADGYGIEPSGEGFGSGFMASQKLLQANGIDPERVTNAFGESLPFPDESFDIVYSANVLEHTQDPEQVLREGMRVLRTGGRLFVEIPNFLSYFEGHYMVVMPPVFWRPMLAWWVKLAFRRDPAFVYTLQTKINPIWARRQVRELRKRYRIEEVSTGEDMFLNRLSKSFAFEAKIVEGSIGGLMRALQAVNVGNWLGHLFVALQAYYPIYIKLHKAGNAQPAPVRR